jgi:hypothetical protein
VIGQEFIQRWKPNCWSRRHIIISSQDGLVIVGVALCWYGEELKGPLESLWGKRGGK